MAQINWSRALLGGLLAGAVWGMLYAPVHPLVEAHDRMGRPVLPITPFRGATPFMSVLVVINGFVLGITSVWLYAGIRPRFGPGPATAAIAGFFVWFLVSLVHLTWAVFTDVRLNLVLLPLAVNLPLVLLAGIAGARFYRE